MPKKPPIFSKYKSPNSFQQFLKCYFHSSSSSSSYITPTHPHTPARANTPSLPFISKPSLL